MQQLTVNPNRTLAFHKPDDERHCLFQGSFQAQVDVVGHCMPFEYLHSLLLTKVPQNSSDGTAEFAVDHLPPILGDEYNVVLALPTDVRQRFDIFHALYLLEPSGASWRQSVFYSRRIGRAYQGRTAVGREFRTY